MKNSIKDKICEAYVALRRKCLDNIFYGRFEIVIKMHPKTFLEFRSEYPYIYEDKECNCFHVNLFGYNTPILIDRELPDTVEFTMQERKDYERQEQEKFYTNLNKMFEEREFR